MRPFLTALVFTASAALPAAAQGPVKEKPAKATGPARETGKPSKDPAPPKEGEKPADGAKSEGPEVPEDLLQDEHLKEEMGVNQFTTPSIRKIFGSLDLLGQLPYDKLKREVPKSVPRERSRIALSLGVLIGDGFLSAQSEKVEDLENIGRAVLRHAKALAAGARVAEHAKAILENSALGDWKTLREDLSATQKDVEAEMVLLRDVEMAHLISMGGWLRGLEIASTAALDPFSAERAAALTRKDVAEYFSITLADFEPRLKKLPYIAALHTGIDEIRTLLDVPEGKPLEQAQVEKIHTKAVELIKLVTAEKP
jgi:hypothetical protein